MGGEQAEDGRLQNPEQVDPEPVPSDEVKNADLCEKSELQDHHPRGRALAHHRDHQG